MILKTLIIDDEPLAQNVLRKYTEDIKSIEVVGFCKNAVDAIEIIEKQTIDLIFLDINMPKLSGIEFLKMLKKPPLVILTTAYSEYAMEGYELNVLDYLVKPFSFARFLKAFQKAEYQFQLTKKTTPEEKAESVFIKSNKKTYQVKFSEILYIEGLGDYIKIYTEKSHLVTNLSMKKMEELLPASDFYRIHKSHIINRMKIIAIEGNMVELPSVKLTIGSNYRTDFFSKISNISI
ncbi:MAG: response regulator transcription factor [Prolixibacteraceae bacterium]|nr:response regulator transcription factor [Prolixibacteraceae bacterium]